MELFWSQAVPVINRMIVDLSPCSYSVKRGARVVDIRLEIESEPKLAPEIKKKKPSPSRQRRNQRRLLMFLEKSKAVPPAEPDNSGNIEVGAGISQVCTGVSSTPAIQHGGTDIPATKLGENVNNEYDDHTEEGVDNSEDNSSEGEDDDSSGDDSSEWETDDSLEDKWWCSKCTKEIIGIIHHCKICDDDDFDLCASCYKREGHMHPMEIIHPDIMSGDEGIPPEDEEPTPGSPDVDSSNVPTMTVDNIDINVTDAILPSISSVKVSSKLVEESVKTRQFITVTRKKRKKKLNDPSSCKTH